MLAENYKAFIEEAFIKPIRSVLIIDDDYPTFDEILSRQKSLLEGKDLDSLPAEKAWYKHPDSIKDVIDHFRAADRSLLVDIHDGSNVDMKEEAEAARHLLQSDLLVLDYQLDRSRPGDGSKAIKIARSVMKNEHFNLVVVHTSENLENVYREMLLGLMRPAAQFLSPAEKASVDALIDEAEDDVGDLTERVKASISTEHYLHFRKGDCQYPTRALPNAPSFAEFDAVCEEAGWVDATKSEVARWALRERERRISQKQWTEVPP